MRGFRLLFACVVSFAAMNAPTVRADETSQSPTFHRDVAPIVHGKCMVCHREGEVAPFPLTSYEEVRQHATLIADVTKRRLMPPWKPDPGAATFKHDRSLGEEQIGVLQDWVAAGAPEGDPDDAPPKPTFPSGWHLGEPDLVLELETPFEVPAEGADIYVHFVFPIKLDGDKYLRAVQVLPSDFRVAHHGVILLDGSGTAKRLARKEGGDRYVNGGAPGFIPRGLLPGYAPGQFTREPEPWEDTGVGLTLAKDLDVVLQMHYHPVGRPAQDRPRIGFYFTDVKPKRGPNIVGMANNDVDIPPGEEAFRRTDEFRLPVDFRVRDIWAHMHLLGRKVEVWAELPDGERKEMLTISDWDFNWQDSYVYEEPFVLPKGTLLKAEWTWDNSAGNARNPFAPPRRVQWGPGSAEEMSGLIVGGASVKTGWEEVLMWLHVLGHYGDVEARAKAAQAKREKDAASQDKASASAK